MWILGQKAAKYSKPPSALVPGLVDELACYQFDNAVLWFCTTVENALNETEKVGVGDKATERAKYTLDQLLDDNFRLPRPVTAKVKRGKVGEQVKALFGTPRKRKESPKVSPLMHKWLERHGGKAA